MSTFIAYLRYPFLWLQFVIHRVGQWLANLFEESKQNKGKNSIAVLDGVRACAILFVIIFHVNRMTGDRLWSSVQYPLASSISTAGGTGVTLFFVLSGFLLFMPFAKALLFKTEWPLNRVFYLRRCLRIIPGYYVSLFLLILFANPQYLQRDHLKDLLLFVTFFMDSSRATFRQLNGPFWTLATEWQFYMILPIMMLVFVLLVHRVPIQKRLKAVTCCLAGVIVLGLFVRFWGFYFQSHPSATFLIPRNDLNIVLFFTFGMTGKYTEDFAVGMFVSLCYIYAQHPSTDRKFAQTWERLSMWLWGAGIIILVFSAMWHFKANSTAAWPFLSGLMPYFNWLSEMVLAFGYGACIAAILYGPSGLKRFFAWPLMRWIGLISYSLYMWHLPLLELFQTRVLPLLHIQNYYFAYSLYWVWVFLVIFPFALLFYAIIEKPWMNLGDQWRRSIEQKHRAKLALKKQAKEAAAHPTPMDQEIAREQEAVSL
ncbi:MAG TPA: acyltransferase [Ktedonobacteraceae bacterium]|nr:acyltransferase [Ktedonobacteraceae bacterium]